ncbi:protein NKG7-like [Eublepharis macularius]|uniref:Protein NKG7-like n=1 Tax=Eublepharis macularius TaxID=481883 RepID=A0AA97LGT8_EUBMA|nr:protein NKG7-like [Eublepharis macularius]
MAAEAEAMGSGRSPEGRDPSFTTLSEMFSNHYMDVLTHPLRISSAICSACSLLILLTSLTTSYWVTERTPQGLIHAGLWEMCREPSCRYFPFRVPEFLHVTRAFLIMAVLCGLVSLIFICISFEHASVGPIYFMVVAGLLSFTAGFFTLIGISVFTAVHKSKRQYIQHLIIFGSSYGLGWASISMYITTAAAHFFAYCKQKNLSDSDC